MTRIAGGDVIRVQPTNNVYTGLAAAGFIVTFVVLVLFYLKTTELGIPLIGA